MEITRIEKTGKKCRLYLNDTPALCLYPSEIRRLGLREGDEFTDEDFDHVCRSVLEVRAKKRCLYLLKSADKTEKELRDKLIRDEYPQQVADAAIEYVKSYGYVDDLRYACRYIESMSGSRSALTIRTNLLRRGIPAEIIEEAMEQSEAPDEGEQIRRLLEKRKFDPERATLQERQKMIRYLLGRGYRYAHISKEIDIESSQV